MAGARAQRSGYPDGTGPIWLSELSCLGVENNISECNSTAYGVHHCDHREDIFVQCQPAQPVPGKRLYQDSLVYTTPLVLANLIFSLCKTIQINNIIIIIIFFFCIQCVPQDKFVSKEAQLPGEELRSATTTCGAQSVMTCGVLLMHKWPVDNWDTPPQELQL